MRPQFFWIPGFILIWAVCAGATTHHVPDEFTYIQMAIDYSSRGDTVLVAPGTYQENIIFNGRDILVGSWYVTTGDTSYVASTRLWGDGGNSVVRFINGESRDARLVGLTLYDGHAQSGGGVYCSASSPTLERLHIRDNVAQWAGGGIFGENGDPLVSNCLIENNRGGQWGGGGIGCEFSAMEIYGCTIWSNFGFESGGGIMIQDSAPLIVGNRIFANDGGAYFGGGIGSRDCTAVITDNYIADNGGCQYGGGLFY